MKVCSKGHLGGTRHCWQCSTNKLIDTKTFTVQGPQPKPKLDRLTKRSITQAIRDQGRKPVADL